MSTYLDKHIGPWLLIQPIMSTHLYALPQKEEELNWTLSSALHSPSAERDPPFSLSTFEMFGSDSREGPVKASSASIA